MFSIGCKMQTKELVISSFNLNVWLHLDFNTLWGQLGPTDQTNIFHHGMRLKATFFPQVILHKSLWQNPKI